MELAAAACVNAVVKGQEDGTYPMIQISGIPHWLVLSRTNVPVPAYASSTTAAASMSLLRADQKPKYNHATDAQADTLMNPDQSGAVQMSVPTQFAAAQPGVANMYPSSGPYPGYHYGYGMTPLCIGHSRVHVDCFQQSKLAGSHTTSLLYTVALATSATCIFRVQNVATAS